MLRYLLLASAAVVVAPAVGMAQPPASPSGQPAATQDRADDFNRSGAAYYASAQDAAQPDVQSPDAQAPDAQGPGAQGPDMNAPYGAAQPPADGSQPYPGQPYQPQASASTPAPGSFDYLSQQPVVIVPARAVGPRLFLHRAIINSRYQIMAARIALRRGQSDAVRQNANMVLQTQSQALVNLVQGAQQSGLRVPARLDFAHRAMLVRLIRAPQASFDRMYMHQQLVAQMNAVAQQASFAQNGGDATLQQAAQQNQQLAQQSLNTTWADSGQPERLARLRDERFQALAQNANRASTFRGYTVFGPTSASQLPAGEEEDYTAPLEGGAGSQTGAPQYQGYTSQPGQPSQPSGAYQNQPGSPGYGAGSYNYNPSAPAGTPNYQGYTPPQTGSSPYYNGQPNAPAGSPSYQGYTSPQSGTTTPYYNGTPSTSPPAYNPAPLQSGPSGVPEPGAGTGDDSMNAPRPPGFTTPSGPGYMAPPVQPQSSPQAPPQPGGPYAS